MHPARKLMDVLPEFAERYPLEMVLDPWLDRMRDKARRGGLFSTGAGDEWACGAASAKTVPREKRGKFAVTGR